MVWWLICCGAVAGITGTGIQFLFASRRRRNASRIRKTGRVVTCVSSANYPASQRLELTGGGVLPGRFGMTNATFPFALMAVEGADLTLRFRPKSLARVMLGVEALTFAAGPDVLVFPARGWFGSPFIGVSDGKSKGYFGWAARGELLGRLESAGFRVDSAERKVELF